MNAQRRSSRWALVVFGVGAVLAAEGCASSPSPEPATPAAALPVVPVGAPAAEPTAAAVEPTEPATRRPTPRAPAGYVEMTVVGVVPSGEGSAVLLADRERSVVVPIFVGGSEALSIDLRHRRQSYERPLTHDLLDRMVRELGGRVLAVHIDGLREGTFLGTVLLETPSRLVEIDARPSDAIALALGNRVPIYVARAVIDEAGVRPHELPPGLPNELTAPLAPPRT